MPRILVTYQNHLDLSWRRPRYSAGNSDGYKIAPYSELQERQLDQAFDFIRQGGCYDLEQTISLREYIERNPDCKDEIKEWIADGRLTVLGGGESVIDYNLPDGESLVRNHLYSRLWLKNNFDYAPTLADCPDTFGLSGNLPQLFRQLGYKGIVEFHRVFGGCKPYWRGISGDVVALKTAGIPVPDNAYTTFRKCRVCTICGGDGCAACGGSGFICILEPYDAEGIPALRDCIMETEGDFRIIFMGEETKTPKNIANALRQLAEETGRELVMTSSQALSHEFNRAWIDGVDEADENDIDPRLEGNPVATGCYTSRIRIKQENRRIESALRTAEHLAVAAALEGVPYPKKALERIWVKLAYYQFHDAIPSSHSDDVYTELMELSRQMRASLSRIIYGSINKFIEKADIKGGEGIPFAVFNPLEFDVENVKLSGVVRCGRYVNGGRVVAPDGTEYPVVSVRRTELPEYDHAIVEWYGSIPAFSYQIMRFIPAEAEEAEETTVKNSFVMENEYLRVTFNDHAVEEVFDKIKNCRIAREGTFAPWITDDPGHAWGRTSTIQYEERADYPNYLEHMLPAHELSRKVTSKRIDGATVVRVYVTYKRPERQIYSLDWCAEFTLADNSRQLEVEIRTAFNARDLRLSTHVVLDKSPVDRKLNYEIPLGQIKRGRVNEFDNQLGYADEWPSLRYVSADMGAYKVTLCNNGTPGHNLKGNHIAVALLRTPVQQCCGFGFDKAIDTEENVFRFTLAADTSDIDAYRRGMVLNTEFPSILVDEQKGTQPETYSFMKLPNDLPLLALKGAEDGRGYIVRYLGLSDEKTLSFSSDVVPANVLEETTSDVVKEAQIKPFGIATFRTDGEILK